MTDTTALRDLLERAIALEEKAAGGVEAFVTPFDDESAEELSVDELKSQVAELEDLSFALANSTPIEGEPEPEPPVTPLPGDLSLDAAEWDDDWDDDDWEVESPVEDVADDDADGAVLIDPELVGKDFGDLEFKEAEGYDFVDLDDDEAKDFDDELEFKDDGDDLEVKGDSETLSEMELLLARREQLGA
jgi:hypothetical protein